MNNTSVVLLIKAGDRRLLFSGDAQLESWKWITQASPHAARNRTRLAKVDLYKVGHHGSRNATPKTSLYKLWAPDGGPIRPVLSLMSTREGASTASRTRPMSPIPSSRQASGRHRFAC